MYILNALNVKRFQTMQSTSLRNFDRRSVHHLRRPGLRWLATSPAFGSRGWGPAGGSPRGCRADGGRPTAPGTLCTSPLPRAPRSRRGSPPAGGPWGGGGAGSDPGVEERPPWMERETEREKGRRIDIEKEIDGQRIATTRQKDRPTDI